MENIDFFTVDSWIKGLNDDVERISGFPKAGTQWYIISAKWIDQWRSMYCKDLKLLSEELCLDKNEGTIDRFSNGFHSTPETEKFKLGPITNEDILDLNDHYEPNFNLKKGLSLSIDYEIIPQKAWNYLKEKFGYIHEIPRNSVQLNPTETTVEIYLKSFKIFFMLNSTLFPEPTFFFFSITQNFSEIELMVNEWTRKNLKLNHEFKIWLWKCNENVSPLKISKLLKDSNNNFPGCLVTDSFSVEKFQESTNFIAEITYACKSSSYLHPKTLEIFNSCNKGLIGFENSGNICYLNSGLQCLFHTLPLFHYFFSDCYIPHINISSKFGSKGKIAAAFADLIKEYWKTHRPILSPLILKRALGGFAPQFMGYNQQDCREMLSFLLDGLHEDLNQVKEKKNIEGQSCETSEKYWKIFLNNNQSIISENFFGLFRNEVKCMACLNLSVNFDPFLMINLPVPTKEFKIKEIGFVIGGILNVLRVQFEGMEKIEDVLQEMPSELMCFEWIFGESEGNQWEIKKILEKSEKIEGKRQILAFGHSVLKENEVPIICNLSWKSKPCDRYDENPGISKIFTLTKMALKDLHLFVYKSLIEELEKNEFSKIEIQEKFENNFPSFYSNEKNDFYCLQAYNPEKFPCPVCLNDSCYGCRINFSDELIQNFVDRSKNKILHLELQFFRDKNEFLSVINALSYQKRYFPNEKSAKKSVSIYDCLISFEKTEELDEKNTLYCKQCKKHTKISKKLNLSRSPKYLILHLKRFIKQGRFLQKNNLKINFPLNNFLIKDFENNEHAYTLYGICNHYGTISNGHYTAFIKNRDGNWYDFDDESVTPITDQTSVVSEAAYVLFYEKNN